MCLVFSLGRQSVYPVIAEPYFNIYGLSRVRSDQELRAAVDLEESHEKRQGIKLGRVEDDYCPALRLCLADFGDQHPSLG